MMATRGLVAQAYRAEHVGSLLRPAALLDARAAFAAGTLALDALRQAEDQAIGTALQLQRDVGLEIFTDGEFRRQNFQSALGEAVDGFEPQPLEPSSGLFGSLAAPRSRLVASRRLLQTRRLADVESTYLACHAPGQFKITLPTPFQYLNYVAGVSDQWYETPADLLRDLSRIIAGEVRALLDEGVRYVQIDAPRYSYFLDPTLARRFDAGGSGPLVTLDEVLAADNACLGVPHGPEVTTAMHLCRGNARSTWYAEGGYDAIAEQAFSTLQADRFLLEYDDERSGGFEPLRFVPPEKTVVLGLVTTKFAQLEDVDTLRRRIDEASRYVPLERLALSPQCGFASLMEGNLISHDAQRRKLELIVSTARKVWGQA
jgi:5-methyltetrahydropteroyltriglutamate--homocysteine methyltransferase